MNAQIVQATGDDHDEIGKAVLGVAQNIFHDADSLDSRQRVLTSHAYPCQLTIGSLLRSSQLAFARLFFGWQISATRGA